MTPAPFPATGWRLAGRGVSGARAGPVRLRGRFRRRFLASPARCLEPRVRAGISLLAQTGEDILAPGPARLAADLSSGRRHARHADLLTRDSVDVGYRLLVAEC